MALLSAQDARPLSFRAVEWVIRSGRDHIPRPLVDLGLELAGEVSRGLAASIAYAFEHEDEAVAYALEYGRGLDTERARRFVKMYVNPYTLDMGEEGRRALEALFERGAAAGLVPAVDRIDLV